MKVEPNALYYGDCLEVMQRWPDEIVDLCYLDPPFNSKSNYNILFGDKRDPDRQQTLAFEDTWHWDEAAEDRIGAFKRALAKPAHAAIAGLHTILGNSGMMAYLSYMAERLSEIRRLLKNTGSIYLHCDPTASHYLKILMDAIFGSRNFRNEIIWHHPKIGIASEKFTSNTDTIFFYVKSDQYQFSRVHSDQPNELYNRWKSKLRDGVLYYKEAKHINDNPAKSKIRVKTKELGRKLKDNDIVVDFNLPENKKVLDNVWKISFLKGNAKENLGYPTQKPKVLLERIIKASSNRGDLVLDPFCGCGTTVDVANRLHRKWLGIDISPFAIDLVKNRRIQNKSVSVHGIPVDLETARQMAKNKPLDFEKWAVTRIPGMMPNSRQVGDGGIDGRGKVLATSGLVLAQVKGGKFMLSQLRDFLHTVSANKAALGIYITVDKVTSAGALAKARAEGYFTLGANKYPKVQLWSMADFFDDRKPDLPSLADPFTGKPMQSDMIRDQAML